VAAVARPAQHRVAAAVAPGEEDAVAVERQEGVVELVEDLEVVGPADADGETVIAVALR
jgi:hypothetical protein